MNKRMLRKTAETTDKILRDCDETKQRQSLLKRKFDEAVVEAEHYKQYRDSLTPKVKKISVFDYLNNTPIGKKRDQIRAEKKEKKHEEAQAILYGNYPVSFFVQRYLPAGSKKQPLQARSQYKPR